MSPEGDTAWGALGKFIVKTNGCNAQRVSLNGDAAVFRTGWMVAGRSRRRTRYDSSTDRPRD